MADKHWHAVYTASRAEKKVREPATIPDDQMERFRFLLDFSEEAVEMVNEHIAVGDRIRVVKGALKGLEGELVRFRGETKVAVRIDLLGCALADIPASFVERLDAPPKL